MPLNHLDLTVDEVKKYLRIDHNSDDDLLVLLIETAKEQAYNMTNNNFTRVTNTGMVEYLTIPFTVKLACLKMIGSWYEHRDDMRTSESLGGNSYSVGDVPWDSYRLLLPYKRLAGL